MSFIRNAFEIGYRRGVEREEAFLEAFFENDNRSVLCSAGCCFECAACAAKPGAPILCQDCLRRRAECAAKHKQERVLLVYPEWLESARKLMTATESKSDDCDTPTIVDKLEG